LAVPILGNQLRIQSNARFGNAPTKATKFQTAKMKGIFAKRRIESFAHRVANRYPTKLHPLEVIWGRATPAFSRGWGESSSCSVIKLPYVGNGDEISTERYRHLLGMAAHELGHGLFTDDSAWAYVEKTNPKACRLLNGIEDFRIENEVIRSGFLEDAKRIFEELTNQATGTTEEYAQVFDQDFDNVPFVLAIEGRRWNGYNLIASSPPTEYSKEIGWALEKCQSVTCTADAAKIAIELWERVSRLKAKIESEFDDHVSK